VKKVLFQQTKNVGFHHYNFLQQASIPETKKLGAFMGGSDLQGENQSCASGSAWIRIK
jgi:hypothetical protein